MFSLVFSKKEGQVDSDKDPQRNKYFFYPISLIMEKIATSYKAKAKNRNSIFNRCNYFLLHNIEWRHFEILVCIRIFKCKQFRTLTACV